MFKQNFSRLLLVIAMLGGISIGITSEAKAGGPNWDIDYEVYVGIDSVRYEIWIDPVDGPPYVASSSPTMNEASYRLFKMVEWNQIPRGADVEIESVAYTDWNLWGEYETRNEAEDVAGQFELLGLPTMIVPVFGGYIYRRAQDYGIGRQSGLGRIGR